MPTRCFIAFRIIHQLKQFGGGFIPPTPIPGYNVPGPTAIGTTNPVQSGVGGTLSFSGNPAQVNQGQLYEDGANNYFTTVLAPGSSGTTMFNSGDSGAIELNAGELLLVRLLRLSR